MNKIQKKLKEITVLLSGTPIQLAEVTLSDGRKATYDGEELKVGIELSIVTDEGPALAEGDFELDKSGTVITCSKGKVTSITEVPAEPTKEEMAEAKKIEDAKALELAKENQEVSLTNEEINAIISKQVAEDIETYKTEMESRFSKLENIAKKQLELTQEFAKIPVVAPSNIPTQSTLLEDRANKFKSKLNK